MTSNVYYVEKTSNTSADTLLAVGLARLLQDVLQQAGKISQGLLIRNAGPHYQIQLPFPIIDNDIRHLNVPPLLVRPFVTEKQKEKQLKLGWDVETLGFPYDTQQQQSRMYYEARKILQAEEKRPEAIWKKERSPQFRQVEELRPGIEYAHYQAISQMKISDTFNEIMRRWYTLTIEQMRSLLEILLDLFRTPLNDIIEASTKWQQFAKDQHIRSGAAVTALQIINPTAGKGANRSRAGELAISGNIDSFWPLEMLKFAGFLYAAAPFVVKESKDRKTYVMQPNTIELKRLKEIMDDFRKVCWSSTAVKLDIMASLRFIQTFVEHRRRFLAAEEEEEDSFEEKRLNNLAQGFEVTFYKDLRSAYATMNVASVHIPSWLPDIKSLSDAESVADLVREHLRVIQGIQDSKGKEGSEEYELLRFYRDFLSGNDLRAFWNFTTAYSGYLMSQREGEKDPKRQVRQLSYKGLEIILMGTQTSDNKLTDITRNTSFKRIAYAIRHSTIIPQHQRAIGQDPVFEIRYGLGQELRRKGRYRDEFMIALSDFLHLYNAEIAREEVRTDRIGDKKAKKLRSRVEYKDIHEIASLIDQFNSSELICAMLVACGYASDFGKKDSQEASAYSAEEFDDSSLDEEA